MGLGTIKVLGNFAEVLVEIGLDEVPPRSWLKPHHALVDDHNVSSHLLGQEGRRVDGEGGAENEEEVAGGDGGSCMIEIAYRLAEENHVRLDDPAARAQGHRYLAYHLLHLGELEPIPAGQTVAGPVVAVDRDDIFRARLLVERVDVLGDDRGELSPSFKIGEKSVAEGRLDGVDGAEEVAGELVERRRVAVEVRDVEDGLRIILTGNVESLRSPEVGDARGGGDAGTGERHHPF
jgi:hypothetical protein